MANFVEPVLAFINQEYEKHQSIRDYRVQDVKQWDIYGSLQIHDHIGKAVDQRIAAPGFCRGLRVFDGVKTGLARLRRNMDVHAITSPSDTDYWQREREQWLVHELGFDRHDITQTHAKQHFCGDALVDDKASTLVNWSARWGNDHRRAIMFSQPWNHREDWSVARVNDWQHLVALLE